MKKVLSIMLAVIIMTGVFALPLSVKAETVPSGTFGTDYFKYGDVNVDNTIDALDALLALQHTVSKFTLAAQKAGVADVGQDGSISSTDALTILQKCVGKSSFNETYYVDKLGGGTNGASPDSVPDKYQKKITFKVSNGTWSTGGTSNIITYKTLKKSGVFSTSGTASLSAPTGMARAYGYTGGAWNTTVPTSVSGTSAVTYTYSFSRMSVNYTIQHFRAATNAGYSSSPTASETQTGYVGDTVSGTAKTYTGYSLDSSKSITSMKLEEGTNTLKFYYGVSSSNYITNYNKSNVVNGAYTKDTTADTSYVVNTDSIKPYTLYKITENAAYNSSGSIDYDYYRLIHTLQGLVNRDFGMDSKHTSVMYTIDYTDANSDRGDVDATWLDYIDDSDSILRKSSAAEVGDGLTQVSITSWSTFYNTFKDVIKSCGIVLWDGNVPATANVATTICGLDGYLPVLASSPLHTELVNAGVPVKLNLVGMFKNGQQGTNITGTSVASTGSAKNDAYIWAVNKYFNRCSSQYLGYVLDGAATLRGYSAYADHITAKQCGWNGVIGVVKGAQLANHDYFIARRMFLFDLLPYGGEAASDDPAQVNGQASIGADLATLKFILQRRYERANGAFGQLIGFPPWWGKYAKEISLGNQPATYLEWVFTELITCYNVAKEADAAQPSEMSNGSVYYKCVPKKSSYTNTTAPMENFGYDQNTFYYTIYVGDYDSSAWLKYNVPTFFSDSRRGTLALMWSINPNLSYRVPMVFDYMYEKKTAKDYFVGGDGGAGYIIPEALFHDSPLAYMGEKRPSGNAAAGTIFANYSKPFYNRYGMNMTGFIINGAQHAITRNVASSISSYSPLLNFTNCHYTPNVRYNNTYFVHCQNQVFPGQYDVMYSHASSYMGSGINFSAYRTVGLTPTEISDLVLGFNSYAESKGMNVRYLDPITYYYVLRDSNTSTYLNATTGNIINFDSLDGYSGAYGTELHLETSNKMNGYGCLNAQFTQVTANVNNTYVGGMVHFQFPGAVNIAQYDEFALQYFINAPITGSASLQVNFVTNGVDDGFNFNIPIDGAASGWHTITMKKNSPTVTVNGADWTKINAVRITYFNNSLKATPNFMLFDNLHGIDYN